MAPLRRFLLRLVHFFQPHRAESELERELAAHLGVLEDEYTRQGLTDAEARLAARRAFGGVAQAKELHRDARSFRWLSDLRQDTRFAARALLRALGFTAVVVGTLALGIGANTALFSVVNGVLLRPLPYRDPSRLVAIRNTWDGNNDPLTASGSISPAEYFDYRDRLRAFDSFGVYAPATVSVTGEGEPEQLPAVVMTAGVLRALGMTPALGRVFSESEDVPGVTVVVLGYG